jgi:hypothetical protein
MATLSRLYPKSLILFSICVVVYLVIFKAVYSPEDKAFRLKSDFPVYYTAATMIKDGETNQLYKLATYTKYAKKTGNNEIEKILFFINTPISALIFVPLTFFQMDLAYKIWVTLSTIIFTALILLIKKNLELTIGWITLFVTTLTVFGSLTYGQVSVLIFTFIYLSYRYIEKNSLLSGVFSALVFIKPQYLLICPFIFLLTKNKKKYLIGFVTTLVILIGINILIYGKNVFYDYFTFISQMEKYTLDGESYLSYNLNSLFVIANKQFALNIPHSVILILVGDIYIYCLYLFNDAKNKNISKITLFAIATVLSLVLSPHTRDTDLLVLLIFQAITASIILKNKHIDNKDLYFALFATYLIQFLSNFHLQWLSSILLFSAVILVYKHEALIQK